MNTKLFFLFITVFVFSLTAVFPQASPVWYKDINALPDSSDVYPVRTLTDANNNIYALTTYSKNATPTVKNKVYLKKYNPAGGTLWTLVYDNNGIGQPRGFDMALDLAGNCYIAGGIYGFVKLKADAS